MDLDIKDIVNDFQYIWLMVVYLVEWVFVAFPLH